MNKRLLLGTMVAAGYTQISSAKALGMSKNTFNNKVNGRGCFDTDDIMKMCELYEITDDRDKVLIFLTEPS